MDAVFIELPPFQNHRAEYLTDEEFSQLQQLLLANPACGDVIQHTGGLRKVRFADARRGKGKRGGIRVIYYWWTEHAHFLLFTLYDKNEAADLSPQQRTMLRAMLNILKGGGTL
ncbi:toxin [Acerihabitans sp. TG2]|uniref:toxin n=1 Tax=Acerihabitans sp. TG2 TaxID=3096008 RepID=UPI002B238BA9|nr:toxin [Acerihabitans sp. TG2]MEA9391729.1 toxin [Acerihabitans sp. TG2]